MQHSLRFAFYLSAILLLVACGTPQPLESIRDRISNIEAQYPAVAVWYTDGSNAFEAECREYQNASAFHYCTVNQPYIVGDWLSEQLEGSYQFQYVAPYEEGYDYQLHLTTANYSNETAGDFAEALISGSSLLLIPMKETYLQKSEIAVVWRDVELGRFNYEFPVESSIGLFSDTTAAHKYAGTELAVAFLNDIANTDIFDAEYLYKELGASDYPADLQYPEAIGDFYYEDMAVLPDPLYGTLVRYIHSTFSFDYIDTFIYPVRSAEWSNPEEALDSELDNFYAEMETAAESDEADVQNMALQEAESIIWPTNNGEIVGRRVIGSINIENGDIYDTYMYLFNQGDKFIKFRASFLRSENPPPNIEADLQIALNEFVVPDESEYMAQLRQRVRNLNPQESSSETGKK